MQRRKVSDTTRDKVHGPGKQKGGCFLLAKILESRRYG